MQQSVRLLGRVILSSRQGKRASWPYRGATPLDLFRRCLTYHQPNSPLHRVGRTWKNGRILSQSRQPARPSFTTSFASSHQPENPYRNDSMLGVATELLVFSSAYLFAYSLVDVLQLKGFVFILYLLAAAAYKLLASRVDPMRYAEFPYYQRPSVLRVCVWTVSGMSLLFAFHSIVNLISIRSVLAATGIWPDTSPPSEPPTVSGSDFASTLRRLLDDNGLDNKWVAVTAVLSSFGVFCREVVLRGMLLRRLCFKTSLITALGITTAFQCALVELERRSETLLGFQEANGELRTRLNDVEIQLRLLDAAEAGDWDTVARLTKDMNAEGSESSLQLQQNENPNEPNLVWESTDGSRRSAPLRTMSPADRASARTYLSNRATLIRSAETALASVFNVQEHSTKDKLAALAKTALTKAPTAFAAGLLYISTAGQLLPSFLLSLSMELFPLLSFRHDGPEDE